MTSPASKGTPDRPGRPSRRISKRTALIISAVAGVLVLAAVIFAVSALSDTDSGGDSIAIETPSEQSARLFADAIEKLKSGDETGAVTALRQAVALDPENEQARTELDRIVREREEQSGGSNNGSSGGDDDPDDPADPGDDSAFNQPVADLTVLLPVTVDGYELGMVVSQGPDAQVPADPTGDGATEGVRRALYSVHDRETATDAQAFVNNVTKTAFPENASTVQVNGIDAYFGTDGARFATVSYSRGRYVFEVIITAEDTAPGALVDIAIEAASAFPTSL